MSTVEIIEANTRTKSDDVTLEVEFSRPFPENLSEAVEMFSKSTDGEEDGNFEKGEKIVFDLFLAQLKIAFQAPARKKMAELWEALTPEIREANMTLVEDKKGDYWKGVLPEDKQTELLNYLKTWIPGQRQPRAKVVRVGDPVKALMDMWGDLTPERRDEIMALMATNFGQSLPSAEDFTSDSEESETEESVV